MTYTDTQQIDTSTLGNGNLTVTFPNGISEAATLISTDLPDAASVDATYQINFGTNLTPADDGNYAVDINASSVTNTGGIAVPAGSIGSFSLTVRGSVSALVPTLGHVNLPSPVIAGNRLNASEQRKRITTATKNQN